MSFVSADYAQIELAILAFLSQDPILLQAFREGKDIHRQTASLIFGVPRTRSPRSSGGWERRSTSAWSMACRPSGFRRV